MLENDLEDESLTEDQNSDSEDDDDNSSGSLSQSLKRQKLDGSERCVSPQDKSKTENNQTVSQNENEE